MRDRNMAACGIICDGCPILKASLGDMKAAEDLANWWKGEGWLEENEGPEDVLAKGPHCTGCHGDRATHWSADCWILQCCVDDKGKQFCNECDEFPCDRLVEWAGQNDNYAEALNRLKELVI